MTRAPEGSRLVRRTLRTPITTRVLLLSAAAAVLIGTVMIVLIVAVTGQRDAARSAFRSQEALAAGNQLEKSLISIENGVRGYVASRRERFLDPANEALSSYPTEVAQLTSLVDDDPGQQARAKEIGGQIDDYVKLWARPLIGVARRRPAQARSIVITNQGRLRLDEIQRDFNRLFAREQLCSARSSRALLTAGSRANSRAKSRWMRSSRRRPWFVMTMLRAWAGCRRATPIRGRAQSLT